jgi:hypothetical protein
MPQRPDPIRHSNSQVPLWIMAVFCAVVAITLFVSADGSVWAYAGGVGVTLAAVSLAVSANRQSSSGKRS